jgi:hypothetical protein
VFVDVGLVQIPAIQVPDHLIDESLAADFEGNCLVGLRCRSLRVRWQPAEKQQSDGPDSLGDGGWA